MVNELLHGTLEMHVEQGLCPRCKNHAGKEKESIFEGVFHYISRECQECGYEVFHKTDVISSGVHR